MPVLVAISMGCTGCRTARIEPPFYPIGVWYRPSTPADEASEPDTRRINDDLATMHRLGFNTVFLYAVDDASLKRIRPIARRLELRLLTPDADAEAYVATGRLPRRYPSLGWLALHTRRLKADLVQLGEVSDAESARRVRALAALHHRGRGHAVPLTFVSMAPQGRTDYGDLGVSLCGPVPGDMGPNDAAVVDAGFGDPGAADTGPGDSSAGAGDNPINVATIDVSQPRSEHDDAADGWLRSYHESLVVGRTAGLVCQPFRSPSPDRIGLVGPGDRVSTKRASIIKRLIRRARKWGPMLRGTTPRRIDADQADSASVDCVLFAAKNRRYVLVMNRSGDAFVRGPVTVSGYLGDAAADRFVSVPVDERVVVGDVSRVRNGRVILETDLAPGDARLYEVF